MAEFKRGTLVEKTLELLNADGVEPLRVYAETGIGFHWLTQLRGGRIKNPSADRIQALYEHLSGKVLDV
jgi:hypothetical protein